MQEAQYQGSRNPGAVPTQQRTLAARLESAASTINSQSSRIEDTLAKINGTPRAGQGPSTGMDKIATTQPLASSVEQIEMAAKRLCDLAAVLEGVA